MAQPWSEEQIAALRDALARGSRQVTYGGQSIQLHSEQELERLLDRMTRENRQAAARQSPGYMRCTGGW